MINFHTFLVHFGFEINKAKSTGLSFGYLCHEDGSIWFSETDDFGFDILVDIEEASNFGFFTTNLIDAAYKAWDILPIDSKITYILPSVFAYLRPDENVDRDLVSQVLYRGIPYPIRLYTPDARADDLEFSEIKIHPDDVKYVDAFLAVNRMGPKMMTRFYPNGIPCNIRNDNELP